MARDEAKINISNQFAGAVARDLRALFDFAHTQDADNLVTGTLLVLMEHLLQKYEKHQRTAKTAIDTTPEDDVPTDWTPPEVAEPLPTPAQEPSVPAPQVPHAEPVPDLALLL